MKFEKARLLKKIEVDEISLVERPATRRKFLVIKEDNTVKELIELLKEFVPESEDADYDVIEKADMKPATLKAIKGALSILLAYKSDMPSDLISAIGVLAKHAIGSPYPRPYKKSEETLEELVAQIEKSGRRLSADMVDKLREITTSLNSLIPKDDQETEEKKVAEKDKVKKDDSQVSDIQKIVDSIKTDFQGEFTKLGERLLTLEKGDKDSKQLKQDKLKKTKKSDDSDLYPTATEAWFGKSEVSDDDSNEDESDDDSNDDSDTGDKKNKIEKEP